MGSDRPSRPDLPALPLDSVLEASSEIDDDRLRRALVMLVSKIDKGFSAMLFYMRNVRERVATLARDKDSLEERLRKVEDELATLRAQREAAADVYAAREAENTAKHRLAAIQGEAKAREKADAKAEKDEERQDEWKQLNLRWKIAIIAGVAGFLTAVATGTFKVIEVLIPFIFGGGGGS